MNNLINDQMYSDQSEEIKPSVKTDVSPQTISFFEDFADRYKMFNNKDRRDKIIRRIKNNRSRTISDEFLEKINAGAFYYPATHTVNTPADVNSNAYTHELTHSLNDSLLGKLHRSSGERFLLGRAYDVRTNFLNKFIHGQKELFTTNTELRRNISDKYNHVLGNELNNVIKNMSDDELLKYVDDTGYLNSNDY